MNLRQKETAFYPSNTTSIFFQGGDFMEKKRSLLHLLSASCVHKKTELAMKFWIECNRGPGIV
jgi:hypothetical protein